MPGFTAFGGPACVLRLEEAELKSCRGAKSRPGRWSGEVFLAPIAGFTLVVQLLEY